MAPFTRNSPSRLTDSDLEIAPGSPAQSGQSSSYQSSSSQGSRRRSSTSQHQNQRSQYVSGQPIPIPNAIPKARVPRVYPDGRITFSLAHAPRPLADIEKQRKLQEEEDALAEKHHRQLQAMMKWDAENSDRDKTVKFPKSAMIERCLSDDSIGPMENVRVGNAMMVAREDRFPPYHKHVMKEYAHQYPHTTAANAYEEGVKVGQKKAQQEYQRGFDDGAKGRQPRYPRN